MSNTLLAEMKNLMSPYFMRRLFLETYYLLSASFKKVTNCHSQKAIYSMKIYLNKEAKQLNINEIEKKNALFKMKWSCPFKDEAPGLVQEPKIFCMNQFQGLDLSSFYLKSDVFCLLKM